MVEGDVALGFLLVVGDVEAFTQCKSICSVRHCNLVCDDQVWPLTPDPHIDQYRNMTPLINDWIYLIICIHLSNTLYPSWTWNNLSPFVGLNWMWIIKQHWPCWQICAGRVIMSPQNRPSNVEVELFSWFGSVFEIFQVFQVEKAYQ